MIYLIGGASRAGKSLLAKYIASKNASYSVLSTDRLIGSYIEKIPAWQDPMFTSDDERGRKFKPHLQELMSKCIDLKFNFIFEGVHILPEIMRDFMNHFPKDIHSLCIGYPTLTVDEKYTQFQEASHAPENWLKSRSEAEQRHYAEGGIYMSHLRQKEAEKYDVPFCVMDTHFHSSLERAAMMLVRGS
jgi:2-phosphoglycerate kinase